MEHRVLIEIISPHTMRFFIRLAAAITAAGGAVHFVTGRLDLYRRARTTGYPVFLLRRHAPEPGTPDMSDHELVRIQAYTPSQAAILHASGATTFRLLHERNRYTHLFIFSGNGIAQQGLATTARALGVKTLFLEIGNIDGKTFADPQGVNAKSRLFHTPSILDSFPVPDAEFQQWRSTYLAMKMQSHTIPQAHRRQSRREALAGMGDKLVRAVGNLSGLTAWWQPALQESAFADCKAAHRPPAFDDVSLQAQPFVFYPMQVSHDSQVMLNSHIDNLGAIRYAAAEAARKNKRLLVKPHPAEPSATLLHTVARLREELHFSLVNNNTFHLLKAASEVITINSTVGLEALIMEKPVTFLGKSLFAHFNDSPHYLASYILGYLVDTAVFGNSPVPPSTVTVILTRADKGAKGGLEA